jgi:Cytochrome C oxidase, cbb3-type, subunit III
MKLTSLILTALSCSLFLSISQAQSSQDSDVAEGMRIFMQKGNCQACHGWSGDGHKMDNQMPDGANLRESKVDRVAFGIVVKCGILGTGMPAFDKNAYLDGRCYGKRKSDLRELGIKMSDPPATLQPREIEELADFVFSKIIGQGPMNREKCLAFWGNADGCKNLN